MYVYLRVKEFSLLDTYSPNRTLQLTCHHIAPRGVNHIEKPLPRNHVATHPERVEEKQRGLEVLRKLAQPEAVVPSAPIHQQRALHELGGVVPREEAVQHVLSLGLSAVGSGPEVHVLRVPQAQHLTSSNHRRYQ